MKKTTDNLDTVEVPPLTERHPSQRSVDTGDWASGGVHPKAMVIAPDEQGDLGRKEFQIQVLVLLVLEIDDYLLEALCQETVLAGWISSPWLVRILPG